jgi:3-oxoacyl-[acyl-carrier-protein] synthase-3
LIVICDYPTNIRDKEMGNDVHIKLTGSGSYLPGDPVTIDKVDYFLGELTRAPVRIQKWLARVKVLMKEMLEVEYYHFAIDPETREFTEDNVTMSVKAARKALEMAAIQPEDLDLIIYGSAHQDQMPTASVRIQEALGIDRCSEISIHANCTSAYKGVLLAHDLLQSGRYKNALIISSSMSSSEMRAEYYHQEILKKEEVFLRYFLSDGSGAVILQAEDVMNSGFYLENSYMESIGGKKPASMLNFRPAYWMNPRDEYEKGFHHLSQMFNEQMHLHFHEKDGSVFFQGLKRMLDRYPFDVSKIRFFQVNFPSRHISEIVLEECEKLGISRDTFYSKMATMGYVGPPMVFICMDKIMREEKMNRDDRVLSFVTEVSKFMQAGFTFQYR